MNTPKPLVKRDGAEDLVHDFSVEPPQEIDLAGAMVKIAVSLERLVDAQEALAIATEAMAVKQGAMKESERAYAP